MNFRKIGIFGGAFDPVHLGHLLPVKELQEKYRLDEIIFIPTGTPNSKKKIEASPSKRVEMLKIALKNYKFSIDMREINSKKISYTFDTISAIKSENKNSELFLIIGSDVLITFQCWRKYMELLDLCNILVTQRGDSQSDKVIAHLPSDLYDKITDYSSVLNPKSCGNIILENTMTYDIASSDIRSRLRDGRTISGLVDENLENWLLESKIY